MDILSWYSDFNNFKNHIDNNNDNDNQQILKWLVKQNYYYNNRLQIFKNLEIYKTQQQFISEFNEYNKNYV